VLEGVSFFGVPVRPVEVTWIVRPTSKPHVDFLACMLLKAYFERLLCVSRLTLLEKSSRAVFVGVSSFPGRVGGGMLGELILECGHRHYQEKRHVCFKSQSIHVHMELKLLSLDRDLEHPCSCLRCRLTLWNSVGMLGAQLREIMGAAFAHFAMLSSSQNNERSLLFL
jgi:hypothetical protein